MSVNYEMLPEHMRSAARSYVEDGEILGRFLQSVLCNELTEAFANADQTNTACMRDWALWLVNEAPKVCWGSRCHMQQYSAKQKEKVHV